AAAFEQAVGEWRLEKLDLALEEDRVGEVVVAGGVAANPLLRRRAAEVVGNRARLTMPPLDLCTDNAAMIAAAGLLGGAPRPADVDPSLGWEPRAAGAGACSARARASRQRPCRRCC